MVLYSCDTLTLLVNLYVCLYLGVGAGGEEQQEAVALSIFHIPWLAFVVFILFVGTLSHESTKFRVTFFYMVIDIQHS